MNPAIKTVTRCLTNRYVRSTIFCLGVSISACSLSDHEYTATKALDNQSDSGLRISMSTEVADVTLDDAIPVKLSMVNTGNAPAPFLPINTGFELALSADVFSVTYNGQRQPYLGIVARRLPPTSDDVLMIGSNEKLEKIVDIAQYYRFQYKGEYTIQYTAEQLTVDDAIDVEFTPIVIEGGAIEITVR